MKHKTNIDMSLGDAIDRLTILIRKIQFGEDAAYPEASHIVKSLNKLLGDKSGDLISAIIRVAYSNFEVWNRENAFRRGEDMSADDVKKMMIEVRDFNSRRIFNKNEINRITEMGWREFKIQHRSR